jgi:site-specific recombinase XerD
MAHFNIDKKSGYIYIVQWLPLNKRLPRSTGVKLNDLSEWDEDKEQPFDLNQKDKNGVKIVDTLARYRNAMADAVKECEVTHGDLKKTFRTKLSGVIIRGGALAVKQELFLEFFDSKVKEFENNKKSNFRSYKTTYNNCVEYFGKKKPTFEELGEDFKDKFTMFLERTKDYKMNTINKQFTNIKAIVGKAYKLKLHKNLDFKNFNTDKEPSVNIFLTLSELDKIYNLDFKNHLHLDRTRDSFIVASFTGLRFGDLGRVRSDLIKGNSIRIQAHKTNEVSQIPIHRYVKAILEKYNGVMPEQLSNQKTNENIKVICRVARLNEVYEKPFTKGGKRKAVPDRFKKWQMCSTHTARRSLCTNLINQKVSPYMVMKISGHKTFEAFEKYIKLDEKMVYDSLKDLEMFKPAMKVNVDKKLAPKKPFNYLDYPPGDVATGKVL